MVNAVWEWLVWIMDTVRALFLPPKDDDRVVWVGETGLRR